MYVWVVDYFEAKLKYNYEEKSLDQEIWKAALPAKTAKLKATRPIKFFGPRIFHLNSSIATAKIGLPLDVSSGSRVAETLNNKTPVA